MAAVKEKTTSLLYITREDLRLLKLGLEGLTLSETGERQHSLLQYIDDKIYALEHGDE